MNLTPFCNNLKAGDRVMDVKSKRQAKVQRTPQDDTSRMTCIIYEGTTTGRYVDVMDLRLILNGRIEEVPPIDGEAPPLNSIKSKVRVTSDFGRPTDPLSMLKAQKQAHAEEIKTMEDRCRTIRAEDERLDRAIAALEGK